MKYLSTVFLTLLFLLILSCQNDDPEIYEEGTKEYTNQWIYQQMKRYYYWNGDMPGQGNLSLDTKEYFARLLHQGDRFSYALHPSIAETFPQNMRGAFGFDISFIEHQGQVYGAILYVLKDSPAENGGLQRGMYIKAINSTVLNQGNYEGLYSDLINADTAQLEVVEYVPESGFSAPQNVSISQGFTLLQPILHRVIVEGNDKVGYIEIPHFDIGLAQSLLQVFQDFKNQSVNKVVVDLRYNGGGDVSSATALSIILAPDIQPGDLFITFKGNNNGGTIKQSFKQSLEMNETHISFQALRDAHPTIQKLYVLCGSRTASASEIIINNLKPFMEVVTIGEKTVGKDVAGFPIEDNRIPGQQGWVLYPSIYKLYNANNEGDYSTGIAPTIELNELKEIMIYPLGDPNEVLLWQALNTISVNGRTGHGSAITVLAKPQIDTETDPLLLKPLE